MPIELLASVEYGGYISFWKLLFFAAGFLGWMPLVNWIFTDSQAVRTNKFVWTLSAALAGLLALIIWLLVPAFFIGLLIYLVVVVGVAVAYVMHRNARVADFEKVLTADHLRGLFNNPHKKIAKASHGLTLITGNGNEAPLPEPKSLELEGYVLLCALLDDAIWRRADEIRFIPQKDDYAIVYLIDGLSAKQDPKSRAEMDAFIYYVKQLADLEVDEKRKPQKGKFTAIREAVRTHWEVSTSGSTAGEQAKLTRVSELVSRKFEDLGLNENQFESIDSLKQLKKGLVLLSGPEKSGVTTSFYTLLGHHDPFLNNINTLEKNPGSDLANITQFTYTLSDTGTTTFARKFQTILRKGPDIVGVADVDDTQTAKLACAAAQDGKIVYVTLEAASVNQAMEKWLKLVGDKALIAETLEAVINQRLVRKLCLDCRQAYQPNPALFKKFNIPADEVSTFYRPGDIEYDKHGKPILCDTCQGTGFYGRCGLFETIRITDPLREVIRNAKSSQEIATAFRRAGMLYMQEQSIKKVSNGITSINEVIRNFANKT
ncbi:MAG: Flp pilus assembly complex ATPase component TadA [Planctomycetaceae bacterium]|nr:Flp pilus assembly complex ATPase component TadA [Planctomycetaceae bacterium]